jgi:hypothetical protein
VSDALFISGSNSSAVATDELFSAAEQLAAMTSELSSCGHSLSALGRDASFSWLVADPPGEVSQARNALRAAESYLADAEDQARSLHGALVTAAQGYGFVDRFVGAVVKSVVADVAGVAGMVAPLALAVNLPFLVMGGAVIGGLLVIPGVRDAASRFLRENNELLNNPLSVALVREGTMAADDAALGMAGVPRPIAEIFGDEVLGISGHDSAAAGVIAVGSTFGLLRETPVRLADSRPLVTSPSISPPTSYLERLNRVPDTDKTGGAQVVIDRYDMTGEPDRFEVYIAGTVTFSPITSDQPFDMTSNLGNAAGPGSGAYDSVAEAMRLAGIDANSPVQFTGYSQGGGTAAQLAASGEYNTAGLTSFGGPTGQIKIPEGFTTVLVEHSDDIVPGLGGTQQNLHAVIVEREVFGGREVPSDSVVPAHGHEYYEDTARLMDAATSVAVTGAIGTLNNFGAGAVSVTSTRYRFERGVTQRD